MKQGDLVMPKVKPSDRLTGFLVLAAAFHALVILGVGFNAYDEDGRRSDAPSFDITLVHTQTEEAPEDAAYFAQANQEGGGNTDERVSAETVTPVLLPEPKPQITSPMPFEMIPETRATRQEVLTVKNAPVRLTADIFPAEKNSDKTVNAAELIRLSRKIASLEMELGEEVQAYSKRPREKWIAASAKGTRDALYLQAWQKKVERVGSLHFPDAATRQGATRRPILDVVLNADGTIYDVVVVKSSGSLALDDQAQRIVRNAAPFAPFSDEMREEYDILHIVRTFSFENGAMATH